MGRHTLPRFELSSLVAAVLAAGMACGPRTAPTYELQVTGSPGAHFVGAWTIANPGAGASTSLSGVLPAADSAGVPRVYRVQGFYTLVGAAVSLQTANAQLHAELYRDGRRIASGQTTQPGGLVSLTSMQ